MNIAPKIKLMPQISLPFDYIKGSETKRFIQAEKLTNDLFQKVKDLYVSTKSDLCSTQIIAVPKNVIEEKLQEILPKPLNIHIMEFQEEDKSTPCTKACPYFEWQENDGNIHILGGGIKMPLTEDKKVREEDIYLLMHEFRHIFDLICNPKISIADAKRTDSLNQLFLEDININKNKFNFINRIIFNFKLNKQMRKLSDEQKVDNLQNMRYAIKTEINAYSKMLKYQDILDKKFGLVRTLKTDKQKLSEYDFDRKLAFLNEKLYLTIQEIRKKHAKKLNTHKVS